MIYITSFNITCMCTCRCCTPMFQEFTDLCFIARCQNVLKRKTISVTSWTKPLPLHTTKFTVCLTNVFLGNANARAVRYNAFAFLKRNLNTQTRNGLKIALRFERFVESKRCLWSCLVYKVIYMTIEISLMSIYFVYIEPYLAHDRNEDNPISLTFAFQTYF